MSKAQWLLFVSEMFVWFPPRILVVKRWWVQSLASSPRMLYTALQKVLPYISQFTQLQKRTVVSVCSELSTAASKLYGRGRKQIQFSKEKNSNNLFFFVNQDACLQLLNCKCKKESVLQSLFYSLWCTELFLVYNPFSVWGDARNQERCITLWKTTAILVFLSSKLWALDVQSEC